MVQNNNVYPFPNQRYEEANPLHDGDEFGLKVGNPALSSIEEAHQLIEQATDATLGTPEVAPSVYIAREVLYLTSRVVEELRQPELDSYLFNEAA